MHIHLVDLVPGTGRAPRRPQQPGPTTTTRGRARLGIGAAGYRAGLCFSCRTSHTIPQLRADVAACTSALALLDNVLSFLPESKPSLQEATAIKNDALAQVAGLLEGRGYAGVVADAVVDAPASSPESAAPMPQPMHGALWFHARLLACRMTGGPSPTVLLPADSATAAPASLEEALGGALWRVSSCCH